MSSGRAAAAMEDALAFGPFLLHRAARTLHEGEAEVRLGETPFAILAALVERAGEQVSADELSVYLAPSPDDSRELIAAHVQMLCRRLGLNERGGAYIARRAGGYCFVEPVDRRRAPSGPALRVVGARNSLPCPGERLVGRHEDIRTVLGLLEGRRVVTVVGEPGIGKSAVAIAAAERAAARFADGVCFVDLGFIRTPEALPAALAAAVGVHSLAEDPIPSTASHLRDKQLLLVLDDCAAVAQAVPDLAARLLEAAPGVRFLASAPRPLRVPDEAAHRLRGLSVEGDHTPSPSLRLMLQRRMERLLASELSDMDLYPYGRLVTALGGAPLSLEIVAGAPPESVDRLCPDPHPTHGQPIPLAAVVRWAFESLDDEDARFLRQLATFNGVFGAAAAEAASALCGVPHPTSALHRLTAAALLMRGVVDGRLVYRLRAPVREQALAALTGEAEALARRRHAACCLDVLRAAEGDWDLLAPQAWAARYGGWIHDVRSAIDWCMASGDRELGVALTAAAVPLAVQLSLVSEFRTRVKQALHLTEGWRRSPVLQMRLNTAFANLAQLSWGTGAEATAAFSRAHEIAERLGIASEQASTLLGVWACAFGKADYPAAAEYSNRLSMVAKVSAEPFITLLADRTSAQAQHFLGRHDRARTLAERVVNYPQRPIPLALSMPGVSRQVSMRIVLARILWMQGRPDWAEEVVDAALAHATADIGIAQCHALALAAAPIALWRGDEARARRHVDQLLDLSSAGQANYWRSWALCFEEVLRWRRGGEPAEHPSDPKQVDAMATFGEVFVTPLAVQRVEAGLVGWCAPEVLRAEGVRLAAAGDEAGAERYLARALTLSRQQKALAWELRAASSLAAARAASGRSGEAADLLRTVSDQFTEGGDTADLRAARAALARIEASAAGGAP